MILVTLVYSYSHSILKHYSFDTFHQQAPSSICCLLCYSIKGLSWYISHGYRFKSPSAKSLFSNLYITMFIFDHGFHVPYLANYSFYPVMHTVLCLPLFILYGKSRVIYTPTKSKQTWPSTIFWENALCSILA